MLSGQSILVFAPGPWHDMWRNRHQIMSRLARQNTILWVEPRMAMRRTRRALREGEHLQWLPSVEHIADGLHVLHNPAALPASGPRRRMRSTAPCCGARCSAWACSVPSYGCIYRKWLL
jgi:hypothetical protein